MKTYKPLLLLTLLIWSSMGHAFNYSCIGKDDTISPNPKTYTDSDGNVHDTAPWTAWKASHSNWSASKDWGCCDKLVLDGSTCKDASLEDTSLTKCAAHGECTGELGCYPMTDDDMFSSESDDPAVDDALAVKESKYEQQQNTLGDEDPKEAGQACYRNMECESYNCKNFKCEAAQTICRLAEKGETAPGQIQCDQGLSKNNNQVCSSSAVPYYKGKLKDLRVTPKPGGTRCEFELYAIDDSGNPLDASAIQGAINLGIRTSRSMEWLYSTVSNANHVDCLFTRQYMKNEMNKLIGERKEILKFYNEDMLYIEENFKIINAAKAEDMQTNATLCADANGNFEVTTFHDISQRKATGLDFLCYMKQRNKLYQEYELAMKQWSSDLQVVTTAYQDSVFSMGEKDKHWTTGKASSVTAKSSFEWKDRNCRDSPKWHKKVKRRWTQKYKVFGRRSLNKDAVNKAGVSQYLEFIGENNAADSFTGKNYYLLDPLMPGGYQKGVSFADYGRRRNFNGDDNRSLGMGLTTVLGALNPIGLAATLGPNKGGLLSMYEAYEKNILDYFKTLRVDTSPEVFILEPEIVGSYEMRGCLDNSARPECAKFMKYVGDIRDFAFAQFLAYSRHHKTKYKRYFNKDNDTWRHKLFRRYDTDLVNLQSYYNVLSGTDGLRDQQNKCLDSLINGLNRDFANTEGTGIATGASNYYIKTSTDYQGGGGRGNDYNNPKIKKSSGTPKVFKLRAFNNSLKDNGGLKDGSSTKTGAGSGSVDGATVGSGLLASRIKKMNEANEKAQKSGVDVAAKSKELSDNLAKAGLISGGSGGSVAAGSGSPSSSGAAGKKATLDNEVDEKKVSSVDPNLLKGTSAGSGSGISAAGALSGIAGGSGYGSTSGSGDGSSSNPSGMSDEQKDIMAANYDRTKGQYKTNEDDSLFEVLSKTYVRNLDKILTRKKKLDEGAASFPSDPSKP